MRSSAFSAEESDLSLESEYFLISRKNWMFQDLTAVGIVWDAVERALSPLFLLPGGQCLRLNSPVQER